MYSKVATSDSVLRRGMNRRATRAMTTRPSLNVTEYACQGEADDKANNANDLGTSAHKTAEFVVITHFMEGACNAVKGAQNRRQSYRVIRDDSSRKGNEK